jgi:hypothetical protein
VALEPFNDTDGRRVVIDTDEVVGIDESDLTYFLVTLCDGTTHRIVGEPLNTLTRLDPQRRFGPWVNLGE